MEPIVANSSSAAVVGTSGAYFGGERIRSNCNLAMHARPRGLLAHSRVRKCSSARSGWVGMLELIVLFMIAVAIAFALMRIPVTKIEVTPNERLAASLALVVLLAGLACARLMG
jgi:hypothetical protein